MRTFIDSRRAAALIAFAAVLGCGGDKTPSDPVQQDSTAPPTRTASHGSLYRLSRGDVGLRMDDFLARPPGLTVGTFDKPVGETLSFYGIPPWGGLVRAMTFAKVP